jgi:hypothetical protein
MLVGLKFLRLQEYKKPRFLTNTIRDKNLYHHGGQLLCQTVNTISLPGFTQTCG